MLFIAAVPTTKAADTRLEVPKKSKTPQSLIPTLQPTTKENVIVYKETTTDHRIDRTKPR
jgi:hypothetical protein